jgi:hypothetical protein
MAIAKSAGSLSRHALVPLIALLVSRIVRDDASPKALRSFIAKLQTSLANQDDKTVGASAKNADAMEFCRLSPNVSGT